MHYGPCVSYFSLSHWSLALCLTGCCGHCGSHGGFGSTSRHNRSVGVSFLCGAEEETDGGHVPPERRGAEWSTQRGNARRPQTAQRGTADLKHWDSKRCQPVTSLFAFHCVGSSYWVTVECDGEHHNETTVHGLRNGDVMSSDCSPIKWRWTAAVEVYTVVMHLTWFPKRPPTDVISLLSTALHKKGRIQDQLVWAKTSSLDRRWKSDNKCNTDQNDNKTLNRMYPMGKFKLERVQEGILVGPKGRYLGFLWHWQNYLK